MDRFTYATYFYLHTKESISVYVSMPIYSTGQCRTTQGDTNQSYGQVFDNTAAAKDGTLEAGDELVGVNDANVFGMLIAFYANFELFFINI